MAPNESEERESVCDVMLEADNIVDVDAMLQ